MRLLKFSFKNEAIWTLAFPCAALAIGVIVLTVSWIVHRYIH